MQTIDRPTQTAPPRPPWTTGAAIALGVVAVPAVVLAIFTKWGVLLLVVVAIAVGLLTWVWQRGFLFIQVVAFLIHFDGIGTGPVRIGRFVAGFAALLLIYKLVVERWRPPALPVRSWAPIWLLFTWAAVSGLWAAESSTWINNMLMFTLGLIYFAAISTLVDSHEVVHKFLRAYWIGGLFGSAVGVMGLVLGGRSSGFNDDPNFFGLLEASMIPLTVYYRRHAETKQQKWLYTVTLILVLGGAAGAGSRSGLISGAIAIVATMVTRPGLSPGRRSRVAITAVLLGAMAFVVGFISNPANLERGFADRGAGRLDFWTVSLPLIKEQPLTGYGFGQIRLLIPPKLRTTQGSGQLTEKREDVSSHNTYLDTVADLGVIGLGIFASVFLIAMYGLIRPRWLQLRELSTTVFVMLVPVLSSAFFLPLLNNKLAWAIIGLSAAMQVPSWDSRWSGLSGAGNARAASGALVPAAAGAGAGVVAASSTTNGSGGTPPGSSPPAGDSGPRLARWDLHLSSRVRRRAIVGVIAGGVLSGFFVGLLPTHYSATAAVFARRLDTSVSPDLVFIDREKLQGVLTLAVSGAYAVELQRLSGVELSEEEVRERMSVTRPRSGNLVQIVYEDTSRERTEAVQPYLLAAMDAVFDSTRAAATEQSANELRPSLPGEQRYYDGPFYTAAYPTATLGEDPPPVAWTVFVGLFGGALIGLGLGFAGARHPRVQTVDDFPTRTGLRVWSHVGHGRRRRLRATAAQYEQVLSAAMDRAALDEGPCRIVVTEPVPEPETPRLALGVAAALVTEGHRVVLIDAQLARPRLRRLLGGRRGLADLAAGADIATMLRPVPAWRLSTVTRRLLGERRQDLRHLPAGTRRARRSLAGAGAGPELLGALDPGVTVVVLAPPTMGPAPVSPWLDWADATVLALREGETTTEHAEDGGAVVARLAGGAAGIVIVNA
ncbi:MAG: O-antigen ligase family protein [Microthrixaceae bacterium]